MDEQRADPALNGGPILDRPVRKRYGTPVLVVYGGIREITMQNGPNTQKDGGNNGVGNRT